MPKFSFLYAGLLVIGWVVACSEEAPAPSASPDTLGSLVAPLVDAGEDGAVTSDADVAEVDVADADVADAD
jgi:hypothetical protein